MVRGFMGMLNDLLFALKNAVVEDVSLDALFIGLIAVGLAVLYLKIRFHKDYDPVATKAKWRGFGRILHWAYSFRNGLLSTIAATSFTLLYLSGVSAGVSKNGAIADFSTVMTTTQTGYVRVEANFGKEGDKDLVYIRRVNPFAVSSGIGTDSTGFVCKAGPKDLADGAKLQKGALLSIALTNGRTTAYNVNQMVVQEWCDAERGSLWNKFKNFVSTSYDWIKNKFA